VLGHGLRRHGHDAGARRQDEEEAGPEEPHRGVPEERPRGRHDQPGDRQGAGHDPQGARLQCCSVVEDERARKEREAQVVDYRGELGHGVAPGGDAAADARRPAAAVGGEDEAYQDKPRGRQGGVHPPAPPPGLGEAARNERAVVEEDDERGRGHHLLRRHAEEAGADREDEPGAGASASAPLMKQ
jgi:hypothetical protein